MIIEISKKFLTDIKKMREKDWNEIVNDNDIQEKIKKLLIYESILQNESIIWKIVSNQFSGVYIPNLKKIVYFTQMLDLYGKSRSRNTFVSQNYITISKMAGENNSSILLAINPYNLGDVSPQTRSILKDIKELEILGVKIGKSIKYNPAIFTNLDSYLELKYNTKKRNKGNNSTYIDVSKNIITVYGNLYGASGCNTINVINVIHNLTGKNIDFYDISNQHHKDKYDTYLNNDYINIVDKEKMQNSLIQDLSINNDCKEFDEIVQRNQSLFKSNIFKKYSAFIENGVACCFICSHPINLIGAHIYRVSDIINDFKSGELSNKQAAHLITSGDNGFLLCPNQDKEFEKGEIIFSLELKEFIINKNKVEEKNYSYINNNLLNNFFIEDIKFSDEFIDNIKKHQIRTGYLIK